MEVQPAAKARDKAATLADVAARAGVSVATASKALSNRYDVADRTKLRVLQAAEELSFSPNLLARGLLGGRTQSVGVITNDSEGRFSLPIMMGAEDALGADSSTVLLSNSRGNPELELQHAKALLSRRVDGLLLVGDIPEPRASLHLNTNVPLVYVYAPSLDPADTSFVCDNTESAKLVTERLISTGRKKIVHIGGPQRETAARDRAEGTLLATTAAGLDLVGGMPSAGEWHETWGWSSVHRLLDDSVKFDALVCGNDQIARGAMDALGARGLRTPQDVAVVGFDNWSVVSRDVRRPFSSVDMNLEELGRAAAKAIMESGELVPGVHKLPGSIVDRGTLG